MSENIQTSDMPEEQGLIAYMFTNHPEQGPVLQSLLDMLYRGVHENTIGIMSAYNKTTDKEELVLVGVLHEGDITRTFPLARVFGGPDEARNYIGPDGEGGWLTDDDEVAETA